MAYTTLITPDEVHANLSDPQWTIIDCRFSLADPAQGRREYKEEHIPGALYAHLDEDLSGPIVPGRTGRHPLPTPEIAARRFGAWGIGAGQQVVAYDGSGGAIAARLWWMLRWLGHEAVAVLDGGWQAWLDAGYAVRSGVETAPSRTFVPAPQDGWVATTAEVESQRHEENFLLIDSRAAERYRGENETIDPVAGHIPGAINLPYAGNLDEDGNFRGREALRAQFESVLRETPSDHVTFYCGSGVSAAHNILAMAHAGLELPRLYVGSWSEWITDRSRPVNVGNEGV